MAYDLVKESENFRGLPMSGWMETWLNWLNSSAVRYSSERGEILFTRGALEYTYDPVTQLRNQASMFLNRDEDPPGNFLGEYITSETPIYVNVSSAFYFVGENYLGSRLNSLGDCIYACRTDTALSSGYYWTMQEENGAEVPLTPTYVEASVTVTVPSDSELASKFEMPIQPPITLIGFVCGYIGIIKRLDEGKYYLRMGAHGNRHYVTDARYQLRVRPDRGFNLFTNVDRFVELASAGIRNNKEIIDVNEPFPLNITKPLPDAKKKAGQEGKEVGQEGKEVGQEGKEVGSAV